MTLINMTEGSKCVVDNVVAGRGLARRLAELGFIKGALLNILRAEGGSLIVGVNGQKYALSRGIAMKISVKEPVE